MLFFRNSYSSLLLVQLMIVLSPPCFPRVMIRRLYLGNPLSWVFSLARGSRAFFLMFFVFSRVFPPPRLVRWRGSIVPVFGLRWPQKRGKLHAHPCVGFVSAYPLRGGFFGLFSQFALPQYTELFIFRAFILFPVLFPKRRPRSPPAPRMRLGTL